MEGLPGCASGDDCEILLIQVHHVDKMWVELHVTNGDPRAVLGAFQGRLGKSDNADALPASGYNAYPSGTNLSFPDGSQ